MRITKTPELIEEVAVAIARLDDVDFHSDKIRDYYRNLYRQMAEAALDVVLSAELEQRAKLAILLDIEPPPGRKER